TCTRSPTAPGSAHASHYAMGDVAFSSTERDRHLGSRPVSQLNTWPMVSPVNASRRPSRDAAHHSGSGWLAGPSPWGTCTSYSLPAFLAHSDLGHSPHFGRVRRWSAYLLTAAEYRTSLNRRLGPDSDSCSAAKQALFIHRVGAGARGLIRATPL